MVGRGAGARLQKCTNSTRDGREWQHQHGILSNSPSHIGHGLAVLFVSRGVRFHALLQNIASTSRMRPGAKDRSASSCNARHWLRGPRSRCCSSDRGSIKDHLTGSAQVGGVSAMRASAKLLFLPLTHRGVSLSHHLHSNRAAIVFSANTGTEFVEEEQSIVETSRGDGFRRLVEGCKLAVGMGE